MKRTDQTAGLGFARAAKWRRVSLPFTYYSSSVHGDRRRKPGTNTL